jgi:plasmid stabilization system protein ParE
LIADPAIQDQIAQTMVDQLYANVDVSARLQQRLPDNLQGLAAPLAGLGREALYRAARELLQRPRVQGLFVNAASLAQAQVVRVLEGVDHGCRPRTGTSSSTCVRSSSSSAIASGSSTIWTRPCRRTRRR